MATTSNDHASGNTPASSTERFADRVADYRRYRPRYPYSWARSILELLAWASSSWPTKRVADVGTGTGFTAAPLLGLGLSVDGVEPNQAMREAAAEDLAMHVHSNRLQLLAGTAEATGLAPKSVDAVFAGQAFHWFDRPAFAAECRRVLKGRGPVLLSWNDRDIDGDAFHRGYEALILRHATDYEQINHQNLDGPVFDAFFGQGQWQLHALDNYQELDMAGFWGRLVSSSYVPRPDSPAAVPMRKEMEALFDAHARQGRIVLRYRLRTYWGYLNE